MENCFRSLDDCLRQRRSVRKFTDKPVARETVFELLSWAIQAPSASNLQPWKFVVVDDAELIRKIKAFSPGLGGLPACILLFCLDQELLPKRRDTGEADESCAVLDLAMAAENLMLAAVERGLGTCVVKSFHPILIKKIMRLPDTVLPEFMISLGYPDQTPKAPRRRPLAELVSYNLEENI